MDRIQYDPRGALTGAPGVSADDLGSLATCLKSARAETLADELLWSSGGSISAEKEPLDAGFIGLPERLLAEYQEDQQESEVGHVLATAERLRETVDRVVVLGIGGSYMGARALMDACCHPYHNELARGERDGRPRLYFEGNNVDNDALAGLLDLLEAGQTDAGGGNDAGGRGDWAIVVISKSGGTLETAGAFRIFLGALARSLEGDGAKLAERVIPVTGQTGKLADLSRSIGCPEIFQVPDGVGGRFSIFSAVGLLPAAILGLDVVQLLRGAAEMNQHFCSAPPGQNVVLDYVGVGHLLETKLACKTRVLSVWSKGLEAVGLWYDQLLAESLGKDERGALPLTVVNTRDLHSRGQQHQEGVPDKLITNLIVQQYRRDALQIGHSDRDQDQLNELAAKTLPEIMSAAIAGTNQAYNDVGRPTADLLLPATDESSLGQLFQMLMLATVVEGRLIGINPYGQPGVEAYKQNMNEILRR